MPATAPSAPPTGPTHSATHSAASTAARANINAEPDATPSAPAVIAGDIAATRWLATGSLLALALLCVAWELWLAPLRPGGSWLALKGLPLLLPLAGLLKRRMYTYRWVSLLVWLYFTEGVVRAWSDPAPSRWLALAELLLCLLLFTACALHVRLRQRAARQASPAASPATPAAPAA